MQEPKIFVIDGNTIPNPETVAMLQALYSRSKESVEKHLNDISAQDAKSGEFLSKWYVGFGHKSIADCGSTTIFIENVSMLAAKAIQDNPLYSGQESSTRYLDMSDRYIVDPINTPQSRRVMEKWMAFYCQLMTELPDYLRTQYPRYEDSQNGSRVQTSQAVYDKAILARSFDIARAFLPAGITTQLSWHTNLRQADDNMFRLLYHPLDEVRRIGDNILDGLMAKYPSTFMIDYRQEGVDSSDFSFNKSTPEQEDWLKNLYTESTYCDMTSAEDWCRIWRSFYHLSKQDFRTAYKSFAHIFSTRPRGCRLPPTLAAAGMINFFFSIDFASFRDIQRHRNGVCPMPILSANVFEPWYLKQIPSELQIEANNLIISQRKLIKDLRTTKEISQYYCAMGFQVQCANSYSIPAAVYLIELRTGKMVHPTLRKVAQWMAGEMKNHIGFDFLPVHWDISPYDAFDPRRGNQDITKKDNTNT